MDQSDIQQLKDLLKVPFVDSYGMTETGGGVFSTLPGLQSPSGSAGVPISPGWEVNVSHVGCGAGICFFVFIH